MGCNACGEYIYKERRFNVRKEMADEKYLDIRIRRFYMRCPACSSEIAFKTDPKNLDYECEKGAKRNFEPWREPRSTEETEEARLDRLACEEKERDKMADLEAKALVTRTEMAVSDKLDEIRMRNARLDRAQTLSGGHNHDQVRHQDQTSEELEDEQAARRAFRTARGLNLREANGEELSGTDGPRFHPFRRVRKPQKNHTATLGIRRKETNTTP